MFSSVHWLGHLMMLFVKRQPASSYCGVNSHSTEKARRSTFVRSEQMSSVRGFGSMSMRRCTRYVVVPLQQNTSRWQHRALACMKLLCMLAAK